MSTDLEIVGKHKYAEQTTPERLILLSLELNKKLQSRFETSSEEIEVHFKNEFENPSISFDIQSSALDGFLIIRKDTFVFSSGISFYQYVYDSKAGTSDPEHFANFRKEIYNLLQIMGGNEVIYLCNNGKRLSDYLYQIELGNSYESVYAELSKRFGPPITDFESIPYTKNDNLFDKIEFEKLQAIINNPDISPNDLENINEFVIDRFSDLA